MRREAVAARLVIQKLKWAGSSCRSLPQLAGRHAVDVGEAARGVSVQIEAFDQRQQAPIGDFGNVDRQRRLVKGLDVAADDTAEQAAQAALGGIAPAECLELVLKGLEGPQAVVLLRKPCVQIVHMSSFE